MGKQEQVALWSGLKRGPPRALKFPTVEEVYDRIVGILGDQQVSKDLTNTQKPPKVDVPQPETFTSPKNPESKNVSTEEPQGNEVPLTSSKSKRKQKSEEEPPQVDSKKATQSNELPKTKSQEEIAEEKPQSSHKRKRTTRSSTDKATVTAKRRK